MILPIVAYGDPVLKKRAEDISRDYPELEKLIADMFETMESADGVGLAAPQVGLGIRLFVVDAAPFSEDRGTAERRTRISQRIPPRFHKPCHRGRMGRSVGVRGRLP